jgi:hypothetical protein
VTCISDKKTSLVARRSASSRVGASDVPIVSAATSRLAQRLAQWRPIHTLAAAPLHWSPALHQGEVF